MQRPQLYPSTTKRHQQQQQQKNIRPNMKAKLGETLEVLFLKRHKLDITEQSLLLT